MKAIIIMENYLKTTIARLGLPVKTWLEQAQNNAKPDQQDRTKVSLVCSSDEFAQLVTELTTGGMEWQQKILKSKKQPVVQVSTASGPHIVVDLTPEEVNTRGMLVWDSDYARSRDLMGQVYSMFVALMVEQLEINFGTCSDSAVLGCLAGLEIASYDYRVCRGDKEHDLPVPGLSLRNTAAKAISGELVRQAAALGNAVNIARHLVNLPAGDLHPTAYAELVTELFSDSENCQVTVWDEQRLKDERMGLLLAVGRAADQPPCLIQLRYRNGKSTKKPLAMVGKGITFDTGGLDLKPSAFMRMMKKDMGGSAALVGLAVWLAATEFSDPVDIWLAVAENAVGEKAFRPGDVITARNGKTVEIDNTDAEGRLVLADVLSVAIAEKDNNQPRAIIDIATLTGAARVALGLQVGALFANDSKLSDALYEAGFESGDPVWPLPLVDAYKKELESRVAELVNSSANRFGGAITAAMFLAEFTENMPWAHLDVNAFSNETQGAISGPGANGQMVQCLVQFLQKGSF